MYATGRQPWVGRRFPHGVSLTRYRSRTSSALYLTRRVNASGKKTGALGWDLARNATEQARVCPQTCWQKFESLVRVCACGPAARITRAPPSWRMGVTWTPSIPVRKRRRLFRAGATGDFFTIIPVAHSPVPLLVLVQSIIALAAATKSRTGLSFMRPDDGCTSPSFPGASSTDTRSEPRYYLARAGIRRRRLLGMLSHKVLEMGHIVCCRLLIGGPRASVA